MTQFRSAPQPSPLPQGRGINRPGLQLAVFGLGFAGLTWAASWWLDAGPGGVALATGGYGLGLGLTLGLFRRGFPHLTLGACNLVTLARLAMTAALLAPLPSGAASPVAVVALALLALSLDGLDGWLARREGRVSDFGARFDMEVDSALGLVLALNAFAAGTVGAAVLLLGVPRYVFAAAALVLPWLDGPLPARFSRKAVCVAQIAVLIALQLPMTTGLPAQIAVAVVFAALVWSFWRDIVWLWQARR